MEFGYYILNTYVPELDGSAPSLYSRYLEQVDAAEASGFDAVWATEHHFRHFGGFTPSPQLLLSALSQRTRRVRLGTSVSILPLHTPLRLAEDFAVLDVLSGGRLEFGAGRGMALSGYEGYRVGWDDAQERMKEALSLIERAWTEPRVTFAGRYFQCENVRVLPRPVQEPRPPIWVTANVDPESFRWIGSQGYDLMTLPWLYPPDGTRERIALYREARAQAGFTTPPRILAMYPAHVAETSEQARAQAEAPWHAWRDYAVEEVKADARRVPDLPAIVQRMSYERTAADRRGVFGSVEECVATACWIRETFGITHLALTFHFGGLSHAAGLRAVELWGRQVAPAVRAALSPASGTS